MARVVLTGIRPNEDAEVVRLKLERLFKTTPDRVRKMLDQGAYVLKADLTEAVANQYQSALEEAGATCRIEADSPAALDVDLPPARQSATALNESTVVQQSQAANSGTSAGTTVTAQSTKPKRSIKEFVVGTVGVLILIQAALWLFGSFGSSSSTSSGTKLEAALRLGESTKTEFETLKDEGGVAKNGAWHGLHVTAVRTEYAENDVLQAFQITVDGIASWWGSSKEWGRKGDTSPREVRELLTRVCNVKPSDWKLEGGEGGMVTRAIESGEMTCLYNRARPNSTDLVIMLSIKRVP